MSISGSDESLLYTGRLQPNVIVDLQDRCLENAEALIDDAKLLIQNGRIPRAFALCVLSVEELGKIVLLFDALFYETSEEWAEFWRRFRKHIPKREAVLAAEVEIGGITNDERQLLQVLESISESIKQLCFYVDVRRGRICTAFELHRFGPEFGKLTSKTMEVAENRVKMFRLLLTGIPKKLRMESREISQKIRKLQEYNDLAGSERASCSPLFTLNYSSDSRLLNS